MGVSRITTGECWIDNIPGMLFNVQILTVMSDLLPPVPCPITSKFDLSPRSSLPSLGGEKCFEHLCKVYYRHYPSLTNVSNLLMEAV